MCLQINNLIKYQHTLHNLQDNWWDCDDVVELSYRIFKSGIYLEYLNPVIIIF